MSSPVAAKTGTVSSQDGTRMPQGRVSSSTSRITQASIASVTELATLKNSPGSSRMLPSGMPR